MRNKIIAAGSQCQHGKDLLCDYLALKLNHENKEPWRRVSFAAQVKKIYCDAFGVDLDFIEKWKTNPDPPPGFNKNVRQGLQFIGDGFRQIEGNVWLELCFRNNQPPMIISDTRYINELRKVKELGGFNILILRSEKLNDDPNGSEAQIRPVLDFFNSNYEEGPVDCPGGLCYPAGVEYVDFFIKNNGTIEEYYQKIDNVLLPYLREIFQ